MLKRPSRHEYPSVARRVCSSPPPDLHFFRRPWEQVMFQIVESFFNTVSHFIEAHGPLMVIGCRRVRGCFHRLVGAAPGRVGWWVVTRLTSAWFGRTALPFTLAAAGTLRARRRNCGGTFATCLLRHVANVPPQFCRQLLYTFRCVRLATLRRSVRAASQRFCEASLTGQP